MTIKAISLVPRAGHTSCKELVKYNENELVGKIGRVTKSRLGAVVQKHFWCVRNGILIDGWQHTTPRESDYKITWVDDDNFVLEFVGLDGSWAKVYSRRAKQQ